MRKFLSVLLAILILASVCVVSFSAAGTGVAKVTLKSVKGDTVTKTYAVGDTITAYTYLNASQLNDGKVGSLHGSQFYTNAVLELDDKYDKDSGIYDLETMFPVTKTATMASGHWTTSEEYEDMGAIYYNASIASYGGFKFNSDTAALIVAKYKVKAAGNAEIINEMTTLASSDRDLTRIIDSGEIINSNFTSPVALSEPILPLPTGFTVSGNITSYLKTEFPTEVSTVTLTGTDNNFTSTVTGDTEYTFESVPAGNYVLSVAKKYHATREYEITVGAEAVAQDVTINPLGDANLNGEVEARDATRVYRASVPDSGVVLEGYAAKCADVNGNGEIEARDATRIYRQSAEGGILYPNAN